MRIRFSPQAAAQVVNAAAWWRRNRRLAPLLFAEELARALQLLRMAPLAGPPYRHPRRRDVRRLVLLKTRYHIYYRVAEDEAVEILAIWSALRERGPRL